MDWMTRHRVSLDISSRAVEIDSPDHEATILYLPQRECNNSCAYDVEGIKLKDILLFANTQMFFQMICLEYPRIGTLSLS
jgi:hypothetical protein